MLSLGRTSAVTERDLPEERVDLVDTADIVLVDFVYCERFRV